MPEEPKKQLKTNQVSWDVVTASGETESVIASYTAYDAPVVPMFYLNSLEELSNVVKNGLLSNQIIKVCALVSNKLYLFGGICSTAIDITVALANTRLNIITDNDELNDIMEHVTSFLNADAGRGLMGARRFNKGFITELMVNGNAYPYESWTYKKIHGKKRYVPNIIKMLNPFAIRILPSKNGLSENVYYNNDIYRYGGAQNLNAKSEGEVIIPRANMRRVTRNGRDYTFYGIPYLTKAFDAISKKMRTLKLDQYITEGLIGLITIFALGNEKDGTFAKKSVVTAFDSLLNSKPNGALYLTWPGSLKVHTVGPDGQILKFSEKYHELDKDIADALGIPMFLISGEFKGGMSGAGDAIKPFKSVVEDLRGDNGDWWVDLTYRIAQMNDLKCNLIEPVYSGVNLEDDKALLSTITNMRDRGLISNTSASSRLKMAVNIEEFLMAKEEKKRKSDPSYTFGVPQQVPFQGQMSQNQNQEEKPEDKNKKKPAGGSTMDGGDGRPGKEEVVPETVNLQASVKADLDEISHRVLDSMVAKLLDENLSTDEKIDIPFVSAVHLASVLGSIARDSVKSCDEFLDKSTKHCQAFSIDIQSLIVKKEITKEIVVEKTKRLIDNIYADLQTIIIRENPTCPR